MNTTAIIKEIDRLPLTDKLLVVEKTLQAIRQEKIEHLKQQLINYTMIMLQTKNLQLTPR